ncbi:hypothetical protein K3G39_13370 [Pontibacter sp. HSC-14F20]|uniref:hypothetical protein n=1 Tax=Pontibacter sp. HSC-14F20 TaxID=2864136 RepID=UPI001C730F34|nr:hypothetical protein [Pontibacter sp. HSC-14F20]MBX0334227.1 hypothetical protein [Pontibacter sp. HSC-14F20]
MRWTLVLLLLLSACVSQRRAGSEEATPSAPAKVPKLYAPAIYARPSIGVDRSELSTAASRGEAASHTYRPTDSYAMPFSNLKPRVITQTLYLTDTLQLDSLHRELQIEQLANQAFRKRLQSTEGERDYWQEKNEQKFWTLIAMAVFAFLYILFRVLASRIKET